VKTGGLTELLVRHASRRRPVLAGALRGEPFRLDLSDGNRDLAEVDLSDPAAFQDHIDRCLRREGASWALGRYGEDRVIYRHSPLFGEEAEPRSLHLGIDLFVPAGTPVQAPLAGRISGWADNRGVGDYGPTVILEHRLEGRAFHTLFGHLDRPSLSGLVRGRTVRAGERIGRVGGPHENGGWPPHLHLQLIDGSIGPVGDYPGVARPSERDRALATCPDPSALLDS